MKNILVISTFSLLAIISLAKAGTIQNIHDHCSNMKRLRSAALYNLQKLDEEARNGD
jgi:hypothetical protein